MALRDKVVRLLEVLRQRYPWLGLDVIIDKIRQGEFEFVRPHEVKAGFEFKGTANLSLFWCQRCGYLGKKAQFRQQGSRIICPICGSPARQSYVGAPSYRGARDIREYSGMEGDRYEVAPIYSAVDAWCRRDRRLKRLVVEDEERPMATLRFHCPDPKSSCAYRQRCRESALYFPAQEGARLIPSHLSEGLTKALVISVYEEKGGGERLAFSAEALPGIEEIKIADVKVYEVAVALLIGHPYARYSERRVALPIVDGVAQMLGRAIETEGIIFRLRQSAIERAQEALAERGFSVGGGEVAHSLAHVILNSLPHLSGLSPSEFSECLGVAEEGGRVLETLVYDNSIGGIGGVRSLKKDGSLNPDLYYYFVSGVECRRDCEVACRACLFFERCGMLNRMLNRHALAYIIDPAAIAEILGGL